MKKIIIHSGFHPEIKREYKGEHIFRVIKTKDGSSSRDYHTGAKKTGVKAYYGLDNGGWIKDLGDERYETDWTGEERWGRVEELELSESGEVLSSETLGFMILRVDRAAGIF